MWNLNYEFPDFQILKKTKEIPKAVKVEVENILLEWGLFLKYNNAET